MRSNENDTVGPGAIFKGVGELAHIAQAINTVTN